VNRFIALILICLLFFLSACAAKRLPPPKWVYEKEAIRMQVKADYRLNYYDEEAHTLLLCIYQLSDPNAFNQLSNDEDGLYTLLDCKLFGDGAAASKRMIIQPGQDIDIMLDRAEGARYVAMAAGYYIMEKDRMVKIVDIPEIVETKGFFRKKKTRKPGRLSVVLSLGPQQITTVYSELLEGQ
jgi:type VI secretion system VasD/TssJ family lipoprotein